MYRIPSSPIRTIATLLALLSVGALTAQEGNTEARIKELEARLLEERQRNARQEERIKELELSLASVLSTQAETHAAIETSRLEGLVDEMLDARAPAADRGGRRLFDVAGAMRISFRSFKGDTISTDESVELEHVLVRFTVRPDDRLTLQMTPAASHEGDVYLVETLGRYEMTDGMDLTVGRFVAPFNGFHAWAFPSDSFVEPYAGENSPKPFLYAPWWDEGLMLSGSVAFGDDDQHVFDYSGWVVNGMNRAGLDGVHKVAFGDNNHNKTVGGRAAASFRLGDDSLLTLGVGAMGGKYDAFDRLDFWAITADMELRVGPFDVYMEYFHRPVEISAQVAENPAVTLVEPSRLSGAKLKLSYRLMPDMTVFVYADRLWVRQPPRTGGQFSVFALDPETFSIQTYVVGLRYDFTANIRGIFELGYFEKDAVLGDDLPFAAISLVFYF